VRDRQRDADLRSSRRGVAGRNLRMQSLPGAVEDELDMRAGVDGLHDTRAQLRAAVDDDVLGADGECRRAVCSRYRDRCAAEGQPAAMDDAAQQVGDTEEPRDGSGHGALEQRARLVVLDDRALEHQCDALAELGCFRAVVRDDQRRQAKVGLQAHDQAADLFAAVGVKRRQRLVEQQQVGLGAQRSRERDALLLATGEAVHRAVHERAQADLLEALAGASVALGLADTGSAQRKRDVVDDVEVRQQPRFLKDDGDAPAVWRHAMQGTAAEQDVAGVQCL